MQPAKMLTREEQFVRCIDGYKSAYMQECKEQIDVDVDYEIDAEQLGIHALTAKGLKFIKFMQEFMANPKVRLDDGVTQNGKDKGGAS
jgi:hypothetical protein